jgi:para-nitrobenzyl esterase
MPRNGLATIDETIETRLGDVRGRAHEGGLAFLGLRFAAPPTGALRFAPPQPPDPWSGVYDATKPGPRALQAPSPPLLATPADARYDEDCLFLNVYTPAADERRRPVLFWIHGGGYTIGSGADYDGGVLARQGDVVVVTINYRLGVLGFTDLSGLDASLAGSASNGFRDQIAALAWVRDNIADYGGDPGCVTIFGESAGAGSVLALLAAPSADGLYHRAVAHSPGGGGMAPANDVPKLEKALSLRGDALLQRLRTIPAADLVRLQTSAGLSNTASIDGFVITRPTVEAIRQRAAAGVPLIAGSNRDEGTLFSALGVEGGGVIDGIAAGVMQGDPSAYLARLRSAHAGAPEADIDLMVWTDMFRRAALRAAEAATVAGPGGWLYRFDLATTGMGGKLGATHGAEVPFTFNWFASSAGMPGGSEGLFSLYDPNDPAVRRLAEAWSATVIAFARTGDPNGAGLPAWPRYAAADRASLVMGAESHIARGLDDAQRKVWGDA